MSDMKEKYLGESKISEQPKKKINLILGDKVVTTSKLADRSVTPDKLSKTVKEQLIDPAINAAKADLQNRIDSIQVGGLALSDSFGESTTIGISQKALTDERDNILQIIEEAKAGGTTMLPFSGAVSNITYPLLYESIEGEGDILYVEDYNVFAIYSETENKCYLLWDTTANRKTSSEYNKELWEANATYPKRESDPVCVIRSDRLFYLEVNGEDLGFNVDNALDASSTNPVTNAAITNKFNEHSTRINKAQDDALASVPIYEISYISNNFDTDPIPDGGNETIYALEGHDLYFWNVNSRAWELSSREGRPSVYIKYGNKVGRLWEDELLWEADFTPTVDTELNADSNNPVSNAVVSAKFSEQRANFSEVNTNLATLFQRTNLSLRLVDGVLPDADYTVESNTYSGTKKEVLIDVRGGRILHKVVVGSTVKYYDKWYGDSNLLPSTAFNPDECAFVYVGNGTLHIGILIPRFFIEIGSNANITMSRLTKTSQIFQPM